MGRSTMSFIKVTLSLAICLVLCLTSRTSAKHLLIETVNEASQDDGAKDYHFIGDGHHHGDYLTRDYESGHKHEHDYAGAPTPAPTAGPWVKGHLGRIGRK